MSSDAPYLTLNDLRIRRLALIAAHQVITSPELAKKLCQGCLYNAAGQSSHRNGCLTPINTVWELLSKADEWVQTYCFQGFNTARSAPLRGHARHPLMATRPPSNNNSQTVLMGVKQPFLCEDCPAAKRVTSVRRLHALCPVKFLMVPY